MSLVDSEIPTSHQKEESVINVTDEQNTDDNLQSESSYEVQTNHLEDTEAAPKRPSSKQMSESELALRNLQNKIKDVQSKLNLNTPVKLKPVETNEDCDNGQSDTNTAPSNESFESRENVKIKERVQTLKLNTDSPVQNVSEEKDDTGSMTTPQNEKQVTEAWNSLGLQRCRFCKFSTDDKELFKNHTTFCTPKVCIVFGDGNFTCETCELTWTNKAEFEEHIVCHTTDDPYVCLSCKKAFESRLLTEQHAKTDHPTGGSVYGLRGMKKSRKIVEELEIKGKYQFRGKLKIPPTPRNKQISGVNSQAVVLGSVVNGVQPSDINAVQIAQTGQTSSAVSGTPAGTATNVVRTEKSRTLDQADINNKLIEKNMEQLRQYLISKNARQIQSDSKIMPQGKHNEPSKTYIATLNASDPDNCSTSKSQQKSVPSVTSNVSLSGSETGATIHYQAKQKQDGRIINASSNQHLGSVSQQAYGGSMIPANVVNTPGPPNVIASKDFISRETGSERDAFRPAVQTNVSQKQRQYHFTEYVHPQPPRPRIPIPSIKPSLATQTVVQTSISPVLPTTVQANTTPILLIPIPPVFSNPVNSMSNVLIPIAQSNPGSQTLVKSLVNNNMPVPNTGAQSTVSSKLNVPGKIDQPVSHITTCTTSISVLALSSKPQLKFTENSFASQTTGSRHTPSHQDHSFQSTVQSKPSVMKSSNSPKLSTVINASASLPIPVQSKTVSESSSFIYSSTMHPTPAVEISVLSDKDNSRQKSSDQKTTAVSMKDAELNLSKRFFFRIKPGHGFVCEACRKFTQDEVIFRRHVWDHFHTVTRSCKVCNTEKVLRKDFMNCNLVSNVVCSLVKRSTNQEKAQAEGTAPEKTISVIDDEIIAISDEEENSKKGEDVVMGENDVIILDEEEDYVIKSQDLDIKIASTYSLSEKDQQSSLKSDSMTDSKIENENLQSSEHKTSLIKEILRDKNEDKNTSDPVETNSVDSSKNKVCEVAKNFSNTDVEEKNEQESKHITNEKQSSYKEPVLASISKDEKHRFERHVLSSQKSSAFYMCGFDQCSFTSLNSKKYKQHLTANHSGAYNYVCCHCGLKNYTEDAHIRHVSSHANMKTFFLFHCPARACKYKTNLIHMFREHLSSHIDLDMKCSYCHKSFKSVQMLITHLKASLIKFVSCPHCQFKFESKAVVAKHIKLAHPDKPRIVVVSSQIVCLERELNFYSPPLAKAVVNESNLKDSSHMVLSESSFDAEAFNHTSEPQIENNSQMLTADADYISETQSPPPPVLTAEITESKGKSAPGIENVSRLKDNVQNVTNITEAPRSLMCSKCNFISWNYKLHQQHLSLHETDEPERDKRFVCMHCPKGFDGLNPFKNHVSNHVGRHELKIYGCTLCVFTTSQRYHIMDHCKDNHLGTGTFFQKTEIVVSKEASCKYCEFKSRQAEQVQLHENIVHVNPSAKQKRTTVLAQQDDEAKRASKLCGNEQVISENSEKSHKYRKYHCHYCMEYFKHKADLRAHMQSSHLDIDDKSFITFKCKYCHFTSTMKALIITHIERKHINEQIRILRRIENIDTPKTGNNSECTGSAKDDKTTYRCEICDLSMDSSEKFKKHFSDQHAEMNSEISGRMETTNLQQKETIFIPDGKFYKEPFQCPKCSYSNKLRVNILRHIKLHPDLIPSRNLLRSDSSSSKLTARKSTSKHSPVKINEKKLKNPFIAVKDAVRELDMNDAEDSKQLKQLSLGGDFLHHKLSACYISLEKSFKCRCCLKNIVKKFVLHKHILNHLHVVFFKCHYCPKGDIEKSLLYSHIQQEHPLKPAKFDNFEISEICREISVKISQQNFSDSSSLQEENSREKQNISGNERFETKIMDDEIKNEMNVFKCSKCDYFARNEYLLKLHRRDHIYPGNKKYGCTACGYRGSSKGDVFKHLRSNHPKRALKLIVLDKDSKINANIEESTSKGSLASVNSDSKETPEKSKAGLLEANKISTKKFKQKVSMSDNILISEAGVFEMKSLYKCKECGEKKNSKWAIYNHFKTSKCYKPWYRCESCAFTNPFKNAIAKHAKIRHKGKKVGIIDLPLSAKIKLVKIPVRQSEQKLKALLGASDSPLKEINWRVDETVLDPRGKSLNSVSSYEHTCRLCGNYKSESLSKLQFHMNTKHQGKPLFCTDCNYKTPLVKHMINHCLNVHGMETAKYTLREEEDEITDGTETVFKAAGNQKYEKEGTATKLTKSSYTSHKKFKCPSCDISKPSIKLLREHMPIHFDYKPFACKYCSAKLQHFSNVRRHVNVCHPGKLVKYSMIKNAKIESKLDQLVAQVHKQMDLNAKPSETTHIKTTDSHSRKKSNKRMLALDEAVLPPKKKSKLLIETDESSEERSEDESLRPSAVKYRVVREPGTSTKFFQCLQCDYKTDQKRILQRHMTEHGRRNYKCYYCEYTGSSISNANRHIKRIHEGKQLKVINKKHNELRFGNRGNVRDGDYSYDSSSDYSVASVKTEKGRVTLKYCCNVCDYVVIGLYHFRQHLATHSNFCYLQKGSETESRLSCGYCLYLAVDDIDFSKHISSHLDERPYRCGYCNYSSYQRHSIQTHLSLSHPEEKEVIIENRDTDLEKPRVKQTMLVDFDPQVVLEKIKGGDKAISNEYINRPVSEKSNAFLSKGSPSKPKVEHDNISLKLSKAIYTFHKEGSVDMSGTKATTSKKELGKYLPSVMNLSESELKLDVCHSENKTKTYIHEASCQRPSLLNVTGQPSWKLEETTKDTKRANEVSDNGQILNQADFFHTDDHENIVNEAIESDGDGVHREMETKFVLQKENNLNDKESSVMSQGDIVPDTATKSETGKKVMAGNEASLYYQSVAGQNYQNEKDLVFEKKDRPENNAKHSRKAETFNVHSVKQQSNPDVLDPVTSLDCEMQLQEHLVDDFIQTYDDTSALTAPNKIKSLKDGDNTETEIGIMVDTDEAKCADTEEDVNSNDGIINREGMSALKIDTMKAKAGVSVIHQEINQEEIMEAATVGKVEIISFENDIDVDKSESMVLSDTHEKEQMPNNTDDISIKDSRENGACSKVPDEGQLSLQSLFKNNGTRNSDMKFASTKISQKGDIETGTDKYNMSKENVTKTQDVEKCDEASALSCNDADSGRQHEKNKAKVTDIEEKMEVCNTAEQKTELCKNRNHPEETGKGFTKDDFPLDGNALSEKMEVNEYRQSFNLDEQKILSQNDSEVQAKSSSNEMNSDGLGETSKEPTSDTIKQSFYFDHGNYTRANADDSNHN